MEEVLRPCAITGTQNANVGLLPPSDSDDSEEEQPRQAAAKKGGQVCKMLCITTPSTPELPEAQLVLSSPCSGRRKSHFLSDALLSTSAYLCSHKHNDRIPADIQVYSQYMQ